MISPSKIFKICLFVCIYIPAQLLAQNQLSNLEFFVDDELNTPPLNLKLESDWKDLAKHKNKPKYQPAKLTFFFDNNDSVVTSVKIKPRGEFRRTHCLFPPLMVNFKKGDFSNSSVNDYDKVKLVTHCRDTKSYKQQMLQEYYIYKIYEMVTDYSFRTRLVKINYLDTLNKREPGENYGFLIETDEQLADRNNAVELKSSSMHPERLNRELTTIMDVFQFMIGNTDWSVVVQHNIKLLKSKDPNDYMPIAIPYDYDYCGLINASYAVPPEQLGIESVTERVYRGFCRTDEEFDKVFNLFIDHKEQILDLYRNSELLERAYKLEAVQYLEESFNILENRPLNTRYIREGCQVINQ